MKEHFTSLGDNSAFGKLSNKDRGKRFKVRGKSYPFSSFRQATRDYINFMPVTVTPRGEADFTSKRAQARFIMRKKGLLGKHLKLKEMVHVGI